MSKTKTNGKGDMPRNCFSKKYLENYESIDWGHATKKPYWEESLCSKLDPIEGCPKCGADSQDACVENNEGFLINVFDCIRCGGNHQLLFKRFNEKCGDHTHFAECPKTNQPVLLKIVTVDKEANENKQ